MKQLAEGVRAGRMRAIAQAITVIDEGGAAASQLLSALADTGELLNSSVRVIGITGAPGAGKSSLSDLLIARYRQRGQRVAVIAVDPSSPFTGGAVLGDRVRMGRHALDSGVFIRSLGARGALGGLAKPARGAVRILAAAGFDIILIETVGVGQSELAVMHVADTVAVVLTPAGGDQVQATKSGIMEVADVFVINKSDLPGAPKLAQAIAGMLDVRNPGVMGYDATWRPPILQVSATRDEGIETVLQTLDAHADHLTMEGRLFLRRKRQLLQELRERVKESLWEWADQSLLRDPAVLELIEGTLQGVDTVEQSVSRLLELWGIVQREE